MLYDTYTGGRSLVSQEFNNQCTAANVEATIQAFPNPGDPERAERLITFRNFSKRMVTVIQRDPKKKHHIIPIGGELKIMVRASEELPVVTVNPDQALGIR
jgi:hypothetical protein